MTRFIQLVVCIIATLCTEVAVAQLTSTNIDVNSSSPVALVYVSSSPNGNSYEINAFSAASNGKLTAVSGSPFAADVQSMAVNANYLFGTNGVDIFSFAIASDGALEKVTSINAQKFNGYNCGGPTALFLDRTGTTLYDEDFYGNICANNTYQSFGIDRSTGKLSYLGASDPSTMFTVPLSFIGNNAYAYGSASHQFYPYIFGFRRNADGKLKDLNINPPMPSAKSGDFYDPYGAASDLSNHVALSVVPFNGTTWQQDGPPQLATYTASASGNLSTKSTFSNMPSAAVKYVTGIRMSPSGKLLAVAGLAGLQIFHFNGGHPITHYTGLLTKDEVDQIFWDNDNHLYAISRSASKVFVFTITPTSFSEAPGSPYTITNPQNITVLPKT
ncbi:MAG TPA: hypothetical protein VNZ03_33415 [Terriglobales bacterium]|nr:hypothetical protein [Terriglobales bacterium]